MAQQGKLESMSVAEINRNYPFLAMFKLFGISYANIKYQPMSRYKIKHHKPKKPGLVSVQFLLMISGMLYFVIKFFRTIHNVDQDAASSVANHAIRKMYAIEVLIAGVVIILQSYLTSDTEHKIILMLDNFDNALKNNISCKFNNMKFQIIFAFKLLFMVLVFATLYAGILYLSYPRDSDIIFPTILLKATVCKFVFHVDLVTFRLKKLIEIIKKDLKKEVPFTTFINNLLSDNPIPNDYTGVKHNISIIKDGYTILADTVELINACYSWIMLILYIIIFCGITYSAYVFFLLVELRGDGNAIIRKLFLLLMR
jgi:hypothetical protein